MTVLEWLNLRFKDGLEIMDYWGYVWRMKTGMTVNGRFTLLVIEKQQME